MYNEFAVARESNSISKCLKKAKIRKTESLIAKIQAGGCWVGTAAPPVGLCCISKCLVLKSYTVGEVVEHSTVPEAELTGVLSGVTSVGRQHAHTHRLHCEMADVKQDRVASTDAAQV